MPRILVSNIDNEGMLADERAFTDAFCRASSITATRMAWFAEPGDIVVVPRDLSADLKQHIARTLGYAPGAVTFVTPDWANGRPRPLGSHELLHMGLAEKLAPHIADPQDWSLYPYCFDRGTQQLADRLGIGARVRPFVKQGGAELLNDKRVFRSLAAGRGVPIARGIVCSTPWELHGCVRQLFEVTGAVIVKQDRHSGGFGNLVISRNGEAQALGASDVLPASDDVQLRDQCNVAWSRLAYVENTPLVVEVYYQATSVITCEFKIDPQNNSVTFLDCGEVRQAPIINGIILPCSLPPYQLSHFIAAATELARLCCDLGYDGLINIDGIVTTDHQVIINEINGRVGGCSHIHHILQTVAGGGYGDDRTVMSHSMNVAMTLGEAFNLLRDKGLAYEAKTRQGIVIVAEDTAHSGHLEYLSIAPSRAEAARIEMAFEGALVPAEPEGDRGGLEHLARILSHLPPAKAGAEGHIAHTARAPQSGTISKPRR
jgi:hypothetical protein